MVSKMDEMVCARISAKEKELLEKMAKYLHKTGRIQSDTISDVTRYALFYVLAQLVFKEIEERRYGYARK